MEKSRIEITRYTPNRAQEWDNTVEESRNGTFLIKRSYLDYHSDRFVDHSLIFEMDGAIIALLPANEEGTTLYSHQGLTYGGLIMTSRCKGLVVLHIFDLVKQYMQEQGYKELIYKPIPHIYHKRPAEEDIYALFRNGAKVEYCGISSTISLAEEVQFSSLRSRGVKKALTNGLTVKEEADFVKFWDILKENLNQRHSVNPVHSLDEIELLKERFPENIHLYVAYKNSELVAGVVMYKTSVCVHSQYIASSPIGREFGALDLVFSYLIKERYKDVKYFDFGISTENGGLHLNEGLLSQKEGFGASATVYPIYKLTI
ncbi:MAG: GNAT family N-acetyltransferase [Bacteroidales bacterium]|nr:GNAT family N-acetyltransferase [Bacteroidales bacterium]